MLFLKKSNHGINKIKDLLRSKTFHRTAIGGITLMIAFVIVLNGATPQKYKLNPNEPSNYNINATREIEDKAKTEHNAQIAADAVPTAMTEIIGNSIDVVNNAGTFITLIEEYRGKVETSLENQEITKKSKNYKKQLVIEQDVAAVNLSKKIKEQKELQELNDTMSTEQFKYLIAKASDEDLVKFKDFTIALISHLMKQDITKVNLEKQVYEAQNAYQSSDLSQNLKIIGGSLVKAILKENKAVDLQLTSERKQTAYDDVLSNKKVIIKKGDKIIGVNEPVTKDVYALLDALNLLEESKFDFALAGGILAILILLAGLLILYMNHFCKKILYSRNDLILLSVIIILTLLIARWISELSSLAIPIFIAAMLISILLDLKLSIIVNFILTIAISFINNGDLTFIYLALISGTFSAFFVSKAHQRSRLFMTGVVIAAINVLIIVCLGIINRAEAQDILQNSKFVALNGIISIILTIGSLPFWETVFNVITPLKLLELANPNQPLIKRLLMEAPGTYHHSLMVGNLAEVATEAIGGNALLARVGAYFHDIGKLKRPNFFKENQLSDNPHDRMTANLSTLVITSHTNDGLELAQKHKIPLAIREIINQHHGTTLVAYFYHKAKKGEKGEDVKLENFRYEGPRPTSKEAAVVLLADSVEAAVRSMIDKTEGKIEGLVRKIIKDKLDDGQLDQCTLTLKDLDDIAKGFLKVFSGFFHEREEYPEVKQKLNESVTKDPLEEIEIPEIKEEIEQGDIPHDSIN